MKGMAGAVAAVVVLLLLAGCTASAPPRASSRPVAIPVSLMRFQSDECLREFPAPEGNGGWGVISSPAVSVELYLATGARDTSAVALAWEAGMEECLGRHPLLFESEPWGWSDLETNLQYLYYAGPLSSCLRSRGIEPEPVGSLEQYRSGVVPLNPYWGMEGDLDHLVDVYRDCPPYLDLPLESK